MNNDFSYEESPIRAWYNRLDGPTRFFVRAALWTPVVLFAGFIAIIAWVAFPGIFSISPGLGIIIAAWILARKR
ncbi:MAG: hypothetical protein JO269_09720 [Burkholderiaceae bacterium]|nr:hypothetical protein [Burkholderiaceae bacterium]